MQFTIPHYYHRFKCIADACSDTCCAGWEIMIDDDSIRQYKNQTGLLGQQFRNRINWKHGSFKQKQGRCAFLMENNLCELYLEGGPSMLCKTCREYPRHTEEFKGVRERSLSMSCEEAANLILGLREPVRFLTKEDGREEVYPEFDSFLYKKLTSVREVLFFLLQNRDWSIGLRASMALGLGHDLQRRIQEGTLCQVDDLLKQYQLPTCSEAIQKKRKALQGSDSLRYEIMKDWFSLFNQLEVISEDWPDYIEDLKDILFEKGEELYRKNRSNFNHDINGSEERKRTWDQWREQLLIYFIYTYFCGAVYDEQPYVKVKMAVVCTMLIEELALGVYLKNGGSLSLSEFAGLAHKVSREIEHSDHNLSTLEINFRTDGAYGIKRILRVL